MVVAINKATGVRISADEAVVRTLGPQWETVRKPEPPRPARRKKPTKAGDE